MKKLLILVGPALIAIGIAANSNTLAAVGAIGAAFGCLAMRFKATDFALLGACAVVAGWGKQTDHTQVMYAAMYVAMAAFYAIGYRRFRNG